MVLPIGDVNPTRRAAVVVWLFTLANLGVFLLLQLPATGCEELQFVYRFSAIPRELTTFAPLSGGELESLLGDCANGMPEKNIALSLVTSLFLHGGLGHLASNLLFLVVFGNNVEDRLGHLRFILFYAVGGAGATLAYTAVRPDSIVPLIGASGAVAAALGAYLICWPRARVYTVVPFPLYLVALVIPGIRIVRWLIIFAVVVLPAWLLLGGWFALQVVSARNPTGEPIAYEAHVGGFLAGVVLLLVMDRWRARHGRQPFHATGRRRRPPRGR
jgi:membrane associated rhomboid family serine protease